MRFGYTDALLERYPQLVAGVIVVQDLSNPSTPPELDALLRLEEKRIAETYTTEVLSSLPSIAAWRAAYSAFGTKPSKYRSSVEGLLRRTVRDGSLPRVSALVDLCNLASLRAMLPVAAFDLDRVSGNLIVDFATGGEGYFPLGEEADHPPYPGEVIYRDGQQMAHSRRWNWRQSDASRVSHDTRRVLITTEALDAGARTGVEAAVGDLTTLLSRFCGGRLQSSLLDRHSPFCAYDRETPGSR